MNLAHRTVGLISAALFVAACSSDPEPGTDAGLGTDLGSRTDLGVAVDLGVDIDLGPGVDAGPRIDLGADFDLGADLDGGGECPAITLPGLTVEDIAVGHDFDAPIFVTQAPGETEALWVVERAGRIEVVRDGSVSTFLDMTSTIGPAPGSMGDERGLLGLAFAPDYETSGRFFVAYTVTSGSMANRVAEYHRSDADHYVADSARVALLVDQTDPQSNHNGGMLAFGPDGKLYVGMGDGGGANDDDTGHGANGNALNLNTLLGKILRLDIDAPGADYAAAGNPFSSPDGLPQIWAYGVRNPWRFSFDRATGDLYIGDVGQSAYEEIDVQAASSSGGENYGWRAYEGNHLRDPDSESLVPVHAAPAVEVAQGLSSTVLRNACAITGGYVYRGSALPDLAGLYFFGDYCSADIAVFRRCGSTIVGPVRVPDLNDTGRALSSFGQDNAGELYMASVSDNRVVRIVGEP
ncbi:MAG: PQQ-dependent sugar dehydrogenase [Sandaracinaceae bacterium]|nr:PQQ-dependent sugar dehydrogenase [Sandaracinaceae bacterium]